MEAILVAASGIVLATGIIALAAMGWQGSPVYRKVEDLAAKAILPGSCFLVGLVLGSSVEPPRNYFVLIATMLIPIWIWGGLRLWRFAAAELQANHPNKAEIKDGSASEIGGGVNKGLEQIEPVILGKHDESESQDYIPSQRRPHK